MSIHKNPPSLESDKRDDSQDSSVGQVQKALPDQPIWENLEPEAQERLKFDYEVQTLLDKQNSIGLVLWSFIRRELRKFHLDRFYSEAYVFNAAYIRGVDAICRGESIRNTSAWLRGTSFRIIRELHRQKHKSCSLDDSFPEIPNPPTPSDDEIKRDATLIAMAFQLLPDEEQKILHLKIVQNLSWKRIREIFIAEGYGDFSEATLRKRKERALNRLRKHFNALKPEAS